MNFQPNIIFYTLLLFKIFMRIWCTCNNLMQIYKEQCANGIRPSCMIIYIYRHYINIYYIPIYQYTQLIYDGIISNRALNYLYTFLNCVLCINIVIYKYRCMYNIYRTVFDKLVKYWLISVCPYMYLYY